MKNPEQLELNFSDADGNKGESALNQYPGRVMDFFVAKQKKETQTLQKIYSSILQSVAHIDPHHRFKR